MATNPQQAGRERSARPGISNTLRDIHGGRFTFRPRMYVSEKSSYGDTVWTWVDDSDDLLSIYSPDRLTLDWPRLRSEYNLTDEITADLQRFSYLRLFYSKVTFPNNRRADNAHPATVVNEIRVTVLFLSHLRKQLSGEGYSLINKLSDIEVEDLSNALSTYSGGQHATLKKVLIYLSNPVFVPLLGCGPLRWTPEDVHTLEWNIKRHEPYGRLPDDLFRALSNSATADVKQFLWALGQVPQDTTKIGEGGNLFISVLPEFSTLYAEYVVERATFRSAREGRNPTSRYFNWLHKNRPRGATLHSLIDRARTAAQAIIALYTGGRLSELNGFKVGCLRQEDDGWVLVGTVIKKRGRNAPKYQDKWVAIPIVRDAVMVLERTAQPVGSEYLFHGDREGAQFAGRMDSNGIRVRIHRYLITLGIIPEGSKIEIHAHMFRHTLVFQLRRAGLNLPFITFQLKHSYDAAQRKLSNVTLGYGGLSSAAMRDAIEEANYEVVRQIYHPEAPVAGGGAEQLKTRRAAFFAGMALPEIDGVLHQLAKQELPLVDVGMGLCQGQKVVVLDGVKTDPPCIGGLRCNPVRCPNGIIPEYKLPWWKRSARENHSRIEDAEFAHARSFYQEAADEADAVVRFLEEQRRKRAGNN